MELIFTGKMDQILVQVEKIFLMQQIFRDDLENLRTAFYQRQNQRNFGSKIQNASATVDEESKIFDRLDLLQSNLSEIQNQSTTAILRQTKTLISGQQFSNAIRELTEKFTVNQNGHHQCQGSHNFQREVSQKKYNDNETSLFPESCSDIFFSNSSIQSLWKKLNSTQSSSSGFQKTMIKQIWPQNLPEPIFVSCEFCIGKNGLVVDDSNDPNDGESGGNWTIIQQRQDGSVNFVRDWIDYKYGFGNLAGEHWLGLEPLHQLTNQRLCELQIELEDFEGDRVWARYSGFAIGSELENYRIKLLGEYSGDAGDALSYHSSMSFSTRDRDNDQWTEGSCAQEHMGGWWYNQCESANLNGLYLLGGQSTQEYKGIYWSEWQGPGYSLKSVRIKIRPVVTIP